MSQTVISVENVSKMYRLGEINTGTFYSDLRHWWIQKHNVSSDTPKESFARKDDTMWALKNVSFSVNKGEMLGVIGENGAGKSTLLKILSQVTGPTSGVIKAKGRIASLLEVGTGFHPELTGRENIFLNGAILGMEKYEIQRKFDEIVDFSGVETFIDSPVKHYSSGMYVRLAFSVSAHLEPDILILDEVFSVGDASFQKKSLNKMIAVTKSGCTILYVSHNLGSIKQFCQSAVWLESGKVVMQGPSSDVTSYYLSKSLPAQGAEKSKKELSEDITKPVQIRSVSVFDRNGATVDFIDLNEEFIIQIDYEFRENLEFISIGCQIMSDENQLTLISLSDPELDSSRLGKRKVGYYRSQVVIPAKILNVGSYSIRAGATQLGNSSVGGTILDVTDGVPFWVTDKVGIMKSLGHERKSSLLSLQVPWNVEFRADN